MPARGDRSAPQFDPRQLHKLRRYFADLDFHFRRLHTTDDQERKCHTCYYVDFETAELWESLTEFGDHARSFANFVQAIYKLYPGSEEERRWLVADLDKIVEERRRIGVRLLGDLGEYYHQFIVIATFAIKAEFRKSSKVARSLEVSNANYGLASRIACS